MVAWNDHVTEKNGCDWQLKKGCDRQLKKVVWLTIEEMGVTDNWKKWCDKQLKKVVWQTTEKIDPIDIQPNRSENRTFLNFNEFFTIYKGHISYIFVFFLLSSKV